MGKTIERVDGWFRHNKSGDLVFQLTERELRGGGLPSRKISVGDTVVPDYDEWDEDIVRPIGDSGFEVAAIGNPFFGPKGKKHVYLYLEEPRRREPVSDDSRPVDSDDPLDVMRDEEERSKFPESERFG